MFVPRISTFVEGVLFLISFLLKFTFEGVRGIIRETFIYMSTVTSLLPKKWVHQ